MTALEETCFVIFALRRSGHHAILNWIARGIPNKTKHLNDVKLKGTSVSGNITRNFNGKAKGPEVLIVNFETSSIDRIDEIKWDKINEIKGKRIVFIYVERDPLNWMASTLQIRRKRKKKKGLGPIQHMIFQYKLNHKLARERDDVLVIEFNKWFSDKKYRNEIAEELGFVNKDTGVDSVAREGGGSSFSGTSHNGKAKNLKVLERWKQFKSDKTFLAFAQDKEIEEIAKYYDIVL